MKKKILISTVSGLVSFILILFALRAGFHSELTPPQALDHLQEVQLETALNNAYPEERKVLHKLSYSNMYPAININAKSAILVDVRSGDILFEKDADLEIPPASMTKLFTMYIVEDEIAKGNLKYDQVIPLPSECWACNMPPHSSLMFLGEGQIVTVEELLTGLSVCSGNDAAYALAYAISGNMDDFVRKMNDIAAGFGLTHTHFVENSGYNELNVTTAREMATFATIYLREHPDSLKRFHSVQKITYPQEHNVAPGDTYGKQDLSHGLTPHIYTGFTQQNTNPLIGKMEGCDGLKTGYIDESGYNLSLTVERNGTRFLSVTLGGPGNNPIEGQEIRARDGYALMNYAFDSFVDFTKYKTEQSYLIKSYGTKEKSVNLVPAYEKLGICVPFITGSSIEENLNNVKITVEYPKAIYGKVEYGQKFGQIVVKLDNYTLEVIPLVSDRSTNKANPFARFIDKILCSSIK